MKKLLVMLTVLAIMLSTCIMGLGTAASALEVSPDSDFVAFDGVIEEYIGPGGTVVIPSVIEGEEVTEIAAYAFANNADITEVYISEGIEVVGYRAFYQCPNLYKMELPYSVYEAGSQAFSHSALEEITVPGQLEVVQYGVFSTNKLNKITISYGVREILTSSFGGNFACDVVFPETVEVLCGFSFTFPEGQDGSRRFTVCNPDCEIGYTVQGVKENLNHSWDKTPCSVGYSAQDNDATMTYIFPKDAEAGKFAEEHFQKHLDSTKGSSCDVSNNRIIVQYRDAEWFEELEENQKDWGITKTRNDLDFDYETGSSGGDNGDDNDGDNDDGDDNNGGSGSNKNNGSSTNKNNNKNNGGSSTTTLIEEGNDSTMWIVLGIVGAVFVLIIAGVVVFAVIFLKKPKKDKAAPSADELRAQLAALEEAEAPVEEAPAEEAAGDAE